MAFQVVPRFDYRVRFTAASDQGRRPHQQDRYLTAPELGLFAVADGVGGGVAGDEAAEAALGALRDSVANSRSQQAAEIYLQASGVENRRYLLKQLRAAFEAANLRVHNLALGKGTERSMGSTLDAVWLARGSALIAHAGDSRVYLARSRTFLQLTHDDSQVGALQAAGIMRPRARRSSALTNAVGFRDEISVDTLFVELSRGDRLLLCTDGVHGDVDNESELAQVLRGGTIEEAAEAFVRRSPNTDGDNATAVLIEIGERFVTRPNPDRGLAAHDLEQAVQSPLLADLARPFVLRALAAAVEVEIPAGGAVQRVVANDLVAYLVLDGTLSCAGRRMVTTGSLIFGESLAGVWKPGPLPTALESTRLLRIRYDDFREVCSDPALGSELYRRLSTHMARSQ